MVEKEEKGEGVKKEMGIQSRVDEEATKGDGERGIENKIEQ